MEIESRSSAAFEPIDRGPSPSEEDDDYDIDIVDVQQEQPAARWNTGGELVVVTRTWPLKRFDPAHRSLQSCVETASDSTMPRSPRKV